MTERAHYCARALHSATRDSEVRSYLVHLSHAAGSMPSPVGTAELLSTMTTRPLRLVSYLLPLNHFSALYIDS